MRQRPAISSVPIALLLGALVLGQGPAAAVQDQAETGDKIFRVDWGCFSDTLDPQLSHGGQWSSCGGLDCEALTRIDEELQAGPGAAAWQFSPDGKTLTFHPPEGLVFGDGVPDTAVHPPGQTERRRLFAHGLQRQLAGWTNLLTVDIAPTP